MKYDEETARIAKGEARLDAVQGTLVQARHHLVRVPVSYGGSQDRLHRAQRHVSSAAEEVKAMLAEAREEAREKGL